MKVSVLMPMRNAAPYVGQAIFSVLAEQSIPLELIVIDDGSTDGSDEIVSSINDKRIRLLPGPQKGIAACMNAGIAHATGDIFMRCDADDLYPPGRIERQAKYLATHPDVVAICGSFKMIDRDGGVICDPFEGNENLAQTPIDISLELCDGKLRTSLCTFAIRRMVMERLDGYRTYFETAEDIDFALRLGGLGSVVFISENSYQYRIHGQSITHSKPSVRRIFFDDQAKLFATQRLREGVDDLMRGAAELPPCEEVPPSTADDHILSLLVGDAWRLFGNGNAGAAFMRALETVRRYPFVLSSWNLLVRLSLKSVLQFFTKR